MMNIPPIESIEEVVVSTADKGVDQGRRKIGAAGVAGTGVILSLASRSAMGGWGSCTGSEIASGNLSRTGQANPCGCSPGYWWNPNGTTTWTTYITPVYPSYSPAALFNTVFGISYFQDSSTALGVIGPNDPVKDRAFLLSENNFNHMVVAMHAVAALLNSAFYGGRYPIYPNPAAVITGFQTAFGFNDTGRKQRLNAFKDQVDIYGTYPNLFCSGKEE